VTDSLFPTCPVCGTAVRDTTLHQRFHDALREMARMIYSPESTPEEWDRAVAEEGARLAAPDDPFADKAAQRGG
jgi:hypothetical protein